jgi:hypothetical protein
MTTTSNPPPTPSTPKPRQLDATESGIVDLSQSSDVDTPLEEKVTAGTRLKRSGSLKSEASSIGTAATGATGSTFSVGAGASGSSARKRVEPMFNLAVHNMMPTVVTDAATDVKVAKVS